MTHQIRLWFHGFTANGGKSDKVYIITLERHSSGRYVVTAKWGRRGGTLSSQVKGNYTSHWAACYAFNALASEKMDKGYTVTDRSGSFCGDAATA